VARRLLQLDGRRRLDVRTRAVDRPVRRRVGIERARGTVLGRHRPGAIGVGLTTRDGHPDRIGRLIGLAGALGIGRAVNLARVARAVRDGRALLTANEPTVTGRGAMEDDLVASGRFVRIEARGELTGLDRPVTVGFVEDDAAHPGALLVAAGSAETAWARNLLAEPACHVRTGERSFDAIAEPLGPAEHARAIRELILRYGTPAEGLGRGLSFRLRPVGEDYG
jgi:deazaflavin-dependent oxidoreductase (nitroreductase family)